jgi:ADP-ribosylglycohydrolase
MNDDLVNSQKDRVLGGLWGALVGDALGAPCLLTTKNFRDCVLKAVNLGGDTDTTGCVSGGLAGVAYGLKSIPADWKSQLPRKGELDRLFHEFSDLVA